jgi:hypothetical protein
LNFPLGYECLGATYTSSLRNQMWEIVLLWVIIGTLFTTLSFVIYIRTDFK